MDNIHKQKTFFGRRKGKGMSKAKELLLEDYLPKFGITLPLNGTIDFSKLFDFKPKKYVFEIGYGDGEHIVNMALKNPDIAFIGTEVFINGNASLIKKIIANDIKNIRVFPDDVNLLFPYLPDEIFSTIFILYPDPWPKNRNEERRMINKNNIEIFSKLLQHDGNLVVVSDHPVYIPWVLMVMSKQNNFLWTAEKSSDFTNPPLDWETTKYERKAILENRKPIYLNFIKK